MADNSIKRLKSQLLKSGLQVKDQALFQVIDQLINALSVTTDAVFGTGGSSGGGGGGGATNTASYATVNNEQVDLPNSRQIYPGPGIEFNDQGQKLVITAAIPFGMDSGGEGEDGPPGPPGKDGPIGPPGPAGTNAVSQFYGFDGIDGEDAPILPGPAGPQGIQGISGVAGPQGIPGLDGNDGVDSFLPGPSGLQGVQGIQGIQGVPGPPGIDAEDPIEPIVLPSTPDVLGGVITLMRTLADQTINAGAATFVDITNLTFPVINGRDYAFWFYIVFRSALATTGWKAGVNHPGGTVDFFSAVQTVANAAAGAATFPFRHNTAVDDMTLLTSTVTANVDLVCTFQGRYKCTANGTFAARFANELAADTNIVVQKGSWGLSF